MSSTFVKNYFKRINKKKKKNKKEENTNKEYNEMNNKYNSYNNPNINIKIYKDEILKEKEANLKKKNIYS